MKKPKIIIEVSGGLVSAVTTNMRQHEIDVYVVDWDNIKAGDSLTDELWMIEKPEADVDGILKGWMEKQ